MTAPATALVVSCEHASSVVPRRYAALFAGSAAQSALRSHRGSDLGARRLARALSKYFTAPYFEASVSRLLVDLNRSLWHPAAYSEFSRRLTDAKQAEVAARYYTPFRAAFRAEIERTLAQGHRVVHLSVHSFTPRLNRVQRRGDVGLLYDPQRSAELELCQHWRENLRCAEPSLFVRRNYPYRGSADGHTTALRKTFAGRPYIGIELELNQALRDGRGEFTQPLLRTLQATFERSVFGRAPVEVR